MCHEPHWSSVLQARYSPASAQLWRDQGWVHRFRISVSNSSCLWFPLHPLFILSDSQRSLLLFPWLGKKMLILLILSQPSEVHPSSGQSSRKLQVHESERQMSSHWYPPTHGPLLLQSKNGERASGNREEAFLLKLALQEVHSLLFFLHLKGEFLSSSCQDWAVSLTTEIHHRAAFQCKPKDRVSNQRKEQATLGSAVLHRLFPFLTCLLPRFSDGSFLYAVQI